MKRTLHDIVGHLDSAPIPALEVCKAAYTLLYTQHIDAKVMQGVYRPSTVDGKEKVPHYWLECFGYIIDYRSTSIVGDSAPHGIFTREQAMGLEIDYMGIEVQTKPIEPHVLEFMTASPTSLFS